MDKEEAFEKIESRLEENGNAYKLILVSQNIQCINDGIEFCKDF